MYSVEVQIHREVCLCDTTQHIPYSRKYWRELNLAVGPYIAICSKNIGGFKFGSSVRDRHTYICKYEILVDFNLVVAS